MCARLDRQNNYCCGLRPCAQIGGCTDRRVFPLVEIGPFLYFYFPSSGCCSTHTLTEFNTTSQNGVLDVHHRLGDYWV